ncbi:hypothetical protein OG884_22790 [Streptosporangium sp. NBC_01755]|uniref:hypothetical protein n=1 Tax=unclassified Streptosporangium TaxID=2632669 RepID=UPI002DD90116|nr:MULTISPECIES: hypothetical protein [unclassified Streptosporangium]WSA24207.1 hypothetical protein OIE13_25125 [Streptosporangium sp. NBC_01810]WSC97717.1 hypothetical protein OG884_22790 [Streptosporangium sp. NBC_01755]
MRVVIALVVLLSAACAPSEAEQFTPSDLPVETSSPAPTQTAPRAETVQVAPGVRVVVEWPATADRDAIGMINTFRDYRAGSFRAVVTGGQDTAYHATVQEGASTDAYLWVKEFLNQRRSVRGTSRLYALNIVSVTGRGAELNACVDETGMRLLDTETGKAVRRQPDWTRHPFLQIAGLRRGDDGIWRIKLLQHAEPLSEASKGCLR